MSSFGLLTTGLNKKLIQDVLDEIEADLRSNINPNLNLLPTSVLGQLNSVYGDKIRELWDVAEDLYNAFDPDTAGGAALENLAAITGVIRLAQTKSTVTLSVQLEAGTTLTVGRVVEDSTTGVQFQTTADITNGTAGTALFNVAAESVLFGPVAAAALSLTTIVTPVTGWLTSSNPLDAVAGTNVETDSELRTRRETLLRVTGKGTAAAIRAAVGAISGVTRTVIFENTTSVIDGNGLPPKSFEVIANGATPPQIAQAIFDTKPLGIEPHGDVVEIVVDTEGINHTVKFSRATERFAWVDVTVTYDAATYPATGDTDIANAIIAFLDSMVIGDDLIHGRLEAIPYGISGVVDVTLFEVDTQPTATASIAGPWNIQVGDVLTLLSGSETIQTATFTSGFTVGAATPTEVKAIIDAQTTNTATVIDTPGAGQIQISSLNGGSVLVTGGTANAAIQFPTTLAPTGVANITTSAKELISGDTSRINVLSSAI